MITKLSFISISSLAKEATGSELKRCALCNFRSESQTEFLAHIRSHKPTVKRGDMAAVPTEAELAAQNNPNSKKLAIFAQKSEVSDCLQCKECGMCFASEPSWKKHLFLLHRIKKPQLDDYCENLVMSLPPAENLAEDFVEDFSENFAENLEEVFEDTTETREGNKIG